MVTEENDRFHSRTKEKGGQCPLFNKRKYERNSLLVNKSGTYVCPFENVFISYFQK